MSARIVFAACVLLGMAAGASEAGAQQAGNYVVSPAGPIDSRNSFVGTNNAVFVVDGAKAQITMCFPDNKDGKAVVACTPPTPLP